MWAVLWFIALATIILFSFVVAFGAPFLPTLRPQVSKALDLINLNPGQTLLELGSGDGRVLAAAAERGLKVIGYELNPLLVLYSWIRTRKYGPNVKIIWGNYWRKEWPRANGIFVFLLDPYMQKLDKKIMQEMQASEASDIRLVSFAFKVPNRKSTLEQEGLFLYEYHM